MTTRSGPTRVVLAELAAGAGSLHEIAVSTGLDEGVVGLAIDRLVTSGHLVAERLAVGCPEDGCQVCPSGSAGRPGCGATVPGRRGAQGSAMIISLGPTRR